MNNIDLQREIAQLQVTIQGLGAENTELRRKLAEQQAQMLVMAEYLASSDSCYSLDGHSLEFNIEELTAQLSAAKQEGYEQGKQAGRDEVLRGLKIVGQAARYKNDEKSEIAYLVWNADEVAEVERVEHLELVTLYEFQPVPIAATKENKA
jgi:translation elongation factor EF-1beta